MYIEQLEYVCMVSKTNSITAAAKKLFVSQQAVSKAINRLEAEFNKKLLNRSYHGMTLTDEGKVFVQHASKIIADYHDLYSIMGQNMLHKKELKGEL